MDQERYLDELHADLTELVGQRLDWDDQAKEGRTPGEMETERWKDRYAGVNPPNVNVMWNNHLFKARVDSFVSGIMLILMDRSAPVSEKDAGGSKA